MIVANNEDGAAVLNGERLEDGSSVRTPEKLNGSGETSTSVGDQGGDGVKSIDKESQDDEYDEEADEDYVGDAKGGQKGGSDAEDDDDDDNDEEFIDDTDKKEIAKYSSIESNEGGLIKTRRQRMEEEAQEKKEKKNHHVHSDAGAGSKSSSGKVDINSIWAELNSTGKSPSPATETASPSSSLPAGKTSAQSADAKVKITRTYEFAGKMISEEKWVEADSEEARAHLNSTAIAAVPKDDQPETPSSTSHSAATAPSQQKNLRRKRKRASLLDAVITNSSKTKLTTLEKSRLDWASYVDKNKIGDELRYKNKAGFLEKQDFLNRVDSRRDNLYSKAKSKISKDN